MTRYSLKRVSIAWLLGVSFLISSCIESNKSEQVELSLSKVPAGVDRLQITLVNFEDTTIVYETLWDAGSVPSSPFVASLGTAKGKNWLVKVKGYQDSLLVYHVLIPSDPSNIPMHMEVRSAWPAVFFTSASLDTTGTADSIKFMTGFHNVPPGAHWHLNFSAIAYEVAYTAWRNVALPKLQKGTFLTADLHVNGTHARLPVQEPDTFFVDEALSPASSKVRITDAYQDSANQVHILLALENFKLPTLDSDVPGEGTPLVHNKKGLGLIPGFNNLDGDPTHLVGPATGLTGIDSVVVALHYARGIRIRPPVQASLSVADALRLRSTIPTLKIVSSGVSAADTNMFSLTLERTNFTGLHTHIYRNTFGDREYQICNLDQCSVEARVWKGAKTLVVAAHFNGTHNPVMPLVTASTSLP